MRRPRRVAVQVVAVHGHVEGSRGNGRAAEARDQPGDPGGEGDSASGDSEDHETVGALVRLEDLVGDAGQCPGDVGVVQHGARAHRRSLLRLTGRD